MGRLTKPRYLGLKLDDETADRLLALGKTYDPPLDLSKIARACIARGLEVIEEDPGAALTSRAKKRAG